MEFCKQLSAYYGDTSYGADRLYSDLIEQAVMADKVGFASVALTEHHLLNVLLNPAPLQMAVKIASVTKNINISTAVAVLPLHDMRIFAGEVIVADILTEGRLKLGVGRGAFAYEMERMGVPMEDTREKFDESLNILQKLLTEEEVSWDGKYYKFDPITVMPRPVRDIQIMMAVLVPEAIYHCAKRGFHIQTTPLSGTHQHMLDQVNAFTRGKAELGEAGKDLTLSLSRGAFIINSEAERQEVTEQAYDYFKRFDNVFTGPGIVKNGAIEPIPRKQTIEELAENLMICTPSEMLDKLSPYADAGVDEIIVNMVFGVEQSRVLESIQAFAEEVIPHFSKLKAPIAAV